MYGNVTLKESFLKRRISSYPKPADLTLSNGKVYDLSFILDEEIAEMMDVIDRQTEKINAQSR